MSLTNDETAWIRGIGRRIKIARIARATGIPLGDLLDRAPS
jgi:hypothetical protein